MILWLIKKVDNVLDTTLAYGLAYGLWPVMWITENTYELIKANRKR